MKPSSVAQRNGIAVSHLLTKRARHPWWRQRRSPAPRRPRADDLRAAERKRTAGEKRRLGGPLTGPYGPFKSMPSPPRRSLAMPASASLPRASGRDPRADRYARRAGQAQWNTIAASTVSCLARSGSAMPSAPDALRPVRGRSADRWVDVRDARRQGERVSVRRASARIGCVAASGAAAAEWPDPRMRESGCRPRSAPLARSGSAMPVGMSQITEALSVAVMRPSSVGLQGVCAPSERSAERLGS